MIVHQQRLKLLKHESWSEVVDLHDQVMFFLADLPSLLGNNDTGVVDEKIYWLIAVEKVRIEMFD